MESSQCFASCILSTVRCWYIRKEVAGILVAQNYRIYSKFLGVAGQV